MKGCDNIGWSHFLIPVLYFFNRSKGNLWGFYLWISQATSNSSSEKVPKRSQDRWGNVISSARCVSALGSPLDWIRRDIWAPHCLSTVEPSGGNFFQLLVFMITFFWSTSTACDRRLVIFHLSQISRGVTWGDLGNSLRPPIFSNTDRPPVCVNAVNEGSAGIINSSKNCASLHTLWKTFHHRKMCTHLCLSRLSPLIWEISLVLQLSRSSQIRGETSSR